VRQYGQRVRRIAPPSRVRLRVTQGSTSPIPKWISTGSQGYPAVRDQQSPAATRLTASGSASPARVGKCSKRLSGPTPESARCFAPPTSEPETHWIPRHPLPRCGLGRCELRHGHVLQWTVALTLRHKSLCQVPSLGSGHLGDRFQEIAPGEVSRWASPTARAPARTRSDGLHLR